MSGLSGIDLTDVPRLKASDVKLLWVNDWYDGPVEAVVEHAGRTCLLALQDRAALESGRAVRWLLFPLTPEARAEQERWHALFVEHVGDHWCFHPGGHAQPSEPRDPERFYAPYKERAPLDLAGTAPAGWLDELPTR